MPFFRSRAHFFASDKARLCTTMLDYVRDYERNYVRDAARLVSKMIRR